MKKICFGLLLLLCLILVMPLAADESVESTPAPELAPFTPSENSCIPPCWFGLTAGKSTASDFESMFSNYDALIGWFLEPYNHYTFDDAEHLIDGKYEFYWIPYTLDKARQGTSEIVIRDSLITRMTIWANENVTLGQILDALGEPDDIIFYQGYTIAGSLDDFTLRLGYFEKGVIVSFASFAGNTENGAMEGVCQIASMQNDFWLLGIHYYSQEEIKAELGWSEQKPKLELPIRSTDIERRIPLNVWREWVQKNQTYYGTCLEGWFSLPEALTSPTSTPES